MHHKTRNTTLALALALFAGGCGNYEFSNPLATADKPAATPSKPTATNSTTAKTAKTSTVNGWRNTSPAALAAMERPETGANPATLPDASAFTNANAFSPKTDYPTTDHGVMIDAPEGLTQVSFAADGADFDPTVSHDGKFIAFASTQHRPTADIYIKQIGSRAVTQITADPGNDVMPAISPDGSRVAFCSDRNGVWNVFVVTTAGGQPAQLTAERTHDLHPTWSPDGKKIAFCRLGQMSGRWELWVLNTDQPSQAEFVGFGMFPQWCPVAATGKSGTDRILFQRGRERGDRAFSLWTIDYKPGDASTPTEVVAVRGLATINPCWSPDGNWIAYALVNPLDPAGAFRSDLFIASTDGAATVNLTSGRYANGMPCWAADNRVYFISDRNGADNIWSLGTERAVAAAKSTTPTNSTNARTAPKATSEPTAAAPEQP
ncbi:MAG: TolB family protein [Phycisphaerales bacterium]